MNYLEIKYGTNLIQKIKQDLVDAYNNYINAGTVKRSNNIVPYLVDKNNKYALQVTDAMNDIIANLDTNFKDLYEKVRFAKNLIENLEANRKEVRESIHNGFVIRKETDKNDREMAKQKFEMAVCKRLHSILQNQLINLNKILSMPEEDKESIKTIPQELSQQDIYMFRKTPAAENFHLDNDEVWAKLWEDKESKDKVTRLIRAINRGHFPKDGEKVYNLVEGIVDLLKLKEENSFKDVKVQAVEPDLSSLSFNRLLEKYKGVI